MSAVINCCEPTSDLITEIFGAPVVPVHCYGKQDQVTPGVMGGWRCSCPCRNGPDGGEITEGTQT